MISEVDSDFLAGYGQSNVELFGFMAELGYEPWHYLPDAGRLERIESPDLVRHANVVFLNGEQQQRFSGRIT